MRALGLRALVQGATVAAHDQRVARLFPGGEYVVLQDALDLPERVGHGKPGE
jgi:hypothetical protein